MAEVEVTPGPDGVRVRVLVKPRASRSGVVGVQGECLAVAVQAPPVDGAANTELSKVLAAHFGLRPRQVSVVSGKASRRKVVSLAGVGIEEAKARLAEVPG